MNIIQYFNNMTEKRFIGLICQFGMMAMSIYAGTLYPPTWVLTKTIQDYVPSLLPFAFIVTIVIFLIFTKETHVMYFDEFVPNDYISDEETKTGKE